MLKSLQEAALLPAKESGSWIGSQLNPGVLIGSSLFIGPTGPTDLGFLGPEVVGLLNVARI